MMVKYLVVNAPLVAHRDGLQAPPVYQVEEEDGNGGWLANWIGDSSNPLSGCDPFVNNITYTVSDLFDDGKIIDTHLSANGFLMLRVNLSGVRMVKLVPNV